MAGSRFSLEAILSLTDNLTSPYKKSVNKITALNGTLNGSFGKLNAGIDRAIMGATKTVAVGLTAGIGLATVAIKKLTTEASKIEDATAGFTPLMGSVEKATELVNRLNKEAATTPFQFEGIASVAKQLLPVMNGSIEDTANTFRMLGDTAGGNIEKLETITRGYTKALLKGKPDMEALNMISEAGVPIFTEMAKSMGVTVEQLFELSKQGKLTNTQLTQTFKNMTSEGGLFFKGMEIASQTLTGKISTMKDNFALLGARLGTAFLPILKSLTDRATELAQKITAWVDANEGLIQQKLDTFIENVAQKMPSIIDGFKNFGTTVINVGNFIKEHKGLIEGLIITLASFKLAIIAVNAVQSIQMGLMTAVPVLNMIKVFMSLAKTEGILATAQLALNMAMTANPIGLIIVGVAALIAGLVLLVKNWDSVTEVIGKVWESFKGFVSFIWDKIAPGMEMLGRGFMTYLLTPVNLVISGIKGLLTLISKIPGVGDALKPAIDSLNDFQSGINTVTLQGMDKTEPSQAQASINNPSPAPSLESHLAMQKEQQQKDIQTKQRYDFYMNAPSGWSMNTAGQTPSTSVQLGVQ